MKFLKFLLLTAMLSLPLNRADADVVNLSLAFSGGTGLFIYEGVTERSSLNLSLIPGLTFAETVRIEVGFKIDLEAKELAEDVLSAKQSAEEAEAAKEKGDVEGAVESGTEAAATAEKVSTTEYRLFSIEPGVRIFPIGGLFVRGAAGPDIVMDGPANFKTQIRLIGGVGYEFHFSILGLYLESNVAKAVGGDVEAGQPNPLYIEGRLGFLLII
ncbi:MAG: hypothetical protein Kow0090_18340 [Myxococcota bacterium]